MIARLAKSKTFWTALAGIMATVGAWMAGEVSGEMAMRTVFDAVLVIFLRDGVAKT